MWEMITAPAAHYGFGGDLTATWRTFPSPPRFGAVFFNLLGAARSFRSATASAVGAFIHLAPRAEIADPRILRRPERTGIETITAADAQIFRMQHDAVFGRIDAGHRADRGTGRIGTMHAGHGHRALAGLAVVDGDDAPAVDAPRHLVLVFACGDTGVAVDASVRVAKKFHARHCSALSRCLYLTKGFLWLLHPGPRIIAPRRPL